tara:strand:- start:140 stop:481 length:342 start_codon:yes stop_codon:yes gene_type:complete
MESPLGIEEIQQIEATSLSSLDRHHLRILAHCLACFKEIANNPKEGSFPDEFERHKWLVNHSEFKNDQAFLSVLLEQFSAAASQLEKIASIVQVSPLELTLENLIQAALDSNG